VLLLVIANAINIGADLGAMADAARLVLGGPQVAYVLLFGAVCATLLIRRKDFRQRDAAPPAASGDPAGQEATEPAR